MLGALSNVSLAGLSLSSDDLFALSQLPSCSQIDLQAGGEPGTSKLASPHWLSALPAFNLRVGPPSLAFALTIA